MEILNLYHKIYFNLRFQRQKYLKLKFQGKRRFKINFQGEQLKFFSLDNSIENSNFVEKACNDVENPW